MQQDTWSITRDQQDGSMTRREKGAGHPDGVSGMTYDQLRAEAARRGIPGRSRLNKAQLQDVLST